MSEGINQLLTFKEACERLRKTDAQARWMLKVGDFPPVAKLGGRLMVRSRDLEAWIEQKFADARGAA